MTGDIVKTCKKHGELKADEVRRAGKYFKCKYCGREYEQTNKEKIRQHKKKYFQINHERYMQYKKVYYLANKDRINKLGGEYWRANKERIMQKKKEYLRINNERRKQYSKEYDQINKERIKERKKEYFQTNKKRISQLNKNKINNLDVSYVKKIIIRKNKFLKELTIPESLIEYERAHLLLKRRLKDQPTLGD